MICTMKAPLLALVFAAPLISVECTVIDPPALSVYSQGPVKTFDPLSLPIVTTQREPFLDPQALFSDQVYVVRPLAKDLEGTSEGT